MQIKGGTNQAANQAANVPPTDEVRVQVTPQNILSAQQHTGEDPLTNALNDATGTLWLACDIGVLIEAVAPFRTLTLSGEVFDQWCHFKTTHTMTPFTFVAQLAFRKRPH